MTLQDLKVEFIKTIMSLQRLVMFPNKLAMSILKKDDSDEYLIQVYRHNVETNEPIDYFDSDKVNPDNIDFKKAVFTFRNTDLKMVNNLLKVIQEVEWHESRN